MSAHNWTLCPRCLKAAKEHRATLEQQIAELYGKITVEAFDALRNDLDTANAFLNQEPEDGTFREDYEFYGAKTGTVTASYSGYCTVCNFSTSFEHKHLIKL